VRRRVLALAVVLGLLGLVLSACGQTRRPPVEVTRVVIETRVIPQVVTREVTREITKEADEALEPVQIDLWTNQREADGGLQFIRSLADDYSILNSRVSIRVAHKDTDWFREDLTTVDRAGDEHDLLWMDDVPVPSLVDANLILPVDDIIKLDKYVDSALAGVETNGQTWGVPMSCGDHLLLMYNKDLIEEAPQNTDKLIEVGQNVTGEQQYGLVYNQADPLWLVPWLGGFTGSVFGEDGKSPTLNTPHMVTTLHFLRDLVYETAIVPPGTDYDGAFALFSNGESAMIIDGEWTLNRYEEALGERLGVARIPRVSATGEWPRPYLRGTYLLLPRSLEEDQAKLEAVVSFIRFATSANNQVLMLAKLGRLPTVKAALEDPFITSDPILRGSAEQMKLGKPLPTSREMECAWQAMEPEMQAVLFNGKSPELAAEGMQEAAQRCIEGLEDR